MKWILDSLLSVACESYEVVQYSYYYYTHESAAAFTAWAVNHDWKEVLSAEGSNDKARAYQSAIDGVVAANFKLITTTRKSTDPLWINASIKRRVRQQRKIYRREGRSAAWKWMKKVVMK